MTGLDYTRADLDTRSRFAVTKERSERLVTAIKEGHQLGGCVLISTCNRTELYASVDDDAHDLSLTRILCEELDQDYQAHREYFSELSGAAVIEHLCRVAAGLDSQILGDDQIVTQTREALELARSQGSSDSYLETLFRVAVQAAKSIKTNVIMHALGSASVPQETVQILQTMIDLQGCTALVIGNGVIGRQVATLLLEADVATTVTLRQYHRGVIQVPVGAQTVGYIDRYSVVEQADIVISATTSNHFTVRCDELLALAKRPQIIIDLAVPRDVEPEVQDIPGIQLLTIDDISLDGRQLSASSLAQIDSIISEHVSRYLNWQKNKEILSRLDRSQSKKSYKPRWDGEHKVKVFAVGLGPGNPGLLAPRAREAILACDCIVGYTSYLKLIPDLLVGKQTISTGMRSEARRCQAAIDAALEGKQVAVICSGDAGIYGMAGLLFELAEQYPEVSIEVIPGITAANAAAAVLGSPLSNDFAVISLSDLLTPWDIIEKRLEAMALADMVLCLYNPQSNKRSNYLARACDILLRHKPPETKCGYVRNAFRGDVNSGSLCTLAELPAAPVDMLTTVIIGNSDTRITNGKLVTARGYRL